MRPAHTEGVEGSSRLGGFARRLHGVGPLLGLVALCIGGTLLNPDFATFDNAMNVLTRTSFIGIISVGMTFGIVLALVLGGLFGLAHGLLVTKGRIEPFIVTLGTLGIFRAVLTWLADGGALTLDNNLSDLYGPVYYASLFGIPVPIWVFLIVAAGGVVVLNRTVFGRHVQAIGSNEQVARYAAIRVDTVKIVTYVLLGLCVGVATVLYVPRLGSATPTTGLLWELEAIAAVVVGGTALRGGEGRVIGTVIGAILLSVIANILNLTSIISVYLNAAVQGAVIIFVAFLQRGRR
jgi:ribose transport system permease protein